MDCRFPTAIDAPPQWLVAHLATVKQDIVDRLDQEPPSWFAAFLREQEKFLSVSDDSVPTWFRDFFNSEYRRVREVIIAETLAIIEEDVRRHLSANEARLATALSALTRAADAVRRRSATALEHRRHTTTAVPVEPDQTLANWPIQERPERDSNVIENDDEEQGRDESLMDLAIRPSIVLQDEQVFAGESALSQIYSAHTTSGH